MITIYKREKTSQKNNYVYSLVELRGLSTDEKPTNLNKEELLDNGSVFIEIDTGDVYLFDAENEEWNKI